MPPPHPLTIAHRAGNRLDRLGEALAAGVDYAEADLWLYRGRLEVRHEKTAGPLPILWDRWLLKPGWTRRLSLEELLAAIGDGGRLLLDLKGRDEGLAEALAKALERAGAVDSVAFTSPTWSYLDRLSELLPEVTRFYTIGSLQRLAALRPRLERREIARVAIDSRMLTAEIVAELGRAEVETITTWAVETPEKAREVLAWGVRGITSDSLPLLVALREGRISASGG